MEIRIVIDDRLLTRCRRFFSRRRLAVLALMLVLLVSATYVYAVDPTPPNSFAPDTVISSSEVNQNFNDIYAAVSALEDDVAATIPVTATGSFFMNPNTTVTVCNLDANSSSSDNVVSIVENGPFCDVTFTSGFEVDSGDIFAMSSNDGQLNASSTGDGKLRIELTGDGGGGARVRFLVIHVD